jgi:hypothetical protein
LRRFKNPVEVETEMSRTSLLNSTTLAGWRAKQRSSGKSLEAKLSILGLAFIASAAPALAMLNSTGTVSRASASATLAVYHGTTPCDDVPRPLPQMPAGINCEQMIWKVVFNHDPATGAPTTFELDSAYGLALQGTQLLQGGGTKLEMQGKWAIVKGTMADPDAVVYQLNPDKPQLSASFLRLDGNLIHLLSSDKTLMIGNGGWSYTLNRMDGPVTETSTPSTGSTSQAAVPPVPTGSSTYGVFDGRTPCAAHVLEMMGFTAQTCDKIKWRLTFNQDPGTGAPTTFKFQGTRTSGDGTWTISRGAKANPAATVYRLTPRGSQQVVSFLKADDNHLLMLDHDMNLLVGDHYISYTLTRMDAPVSKCYAQTMQCLRGLFMQYWESNGGLAQLGFPISRELVEGGRTVQYTQRARLEWHPENRGTQYAVLLGRLGASMAAERAARGERPFARVARPTGGAAMYFPETGHTLAAPLRAYWEANGGLPVFGYPLSEAFQERSPTDGKTYLVQYFERNRLEHHPEHQGTPDEVQLGLLGTQEYARRYRP